MGPALSPPLAAALSSSPTLANGAAGWWNASLGAPVARPALPGPTEADVCIVGAGYTGLWTALFLRRARPDLRVVVLEARHVGFGASGRNGGWLSGLMPGDRNLLARRDGRAGVIALQRALEAAVDEVITVCAEEGIEADIHKGGTMFVATAPAQWSRLRAGLVTDREWGVGPADAWPLDADEVRSRVAVTGALGGVYSPHCARIHPARLARGLADAVTRSGATIHERTPALSVSPHRVTTPAGTVTARHVVVATEGFTARLPGRRRRLLPMNSSMVVTEPLEERHWKELGWSGRETLGSGAHAYLYAQRTADDRIAIGGRGIPYRFGSRTDVDGFVAPSTIEALRAGLGPLLPGLDDVGLAHAWCGVLGVARDWCPSVGLDPVSGLAWAGGYVGDGVATSHVAGRTVAELIAGLDTPRTRLPWVGHRSPDWEPEPLRWLGVHAMYALYRRADRVEARSGSSRTSGWALVADRVSGRP